MIYCPFIDLNSDLIHTDSAPSEKSTTPLSSSSQPRTPTNMRKRKADFMDNTP